MKFGDIRTLYTRSKFHKMPSFFIFGSHFMGSSIFASLLSKDMNIYHISDQIIFQKIKKAEKKSETEIPSPFYFFKNYQKETSQIVSELILQNQAKTRAFLFEDFSYFIEPVCLKINPEKILIIDLIVQDDISLNSLKEELFCLNCGETFNEKVLKEIEFKLPPKISKKMNLCEFCEHPLMKKSEKQAGEIQKQMDYLKNKQIQSLKSEGARVLSVNSKFGIKNYHEFRDFLLLELENHQTK